MLGAYYSTITNRPGNRFAKLRIVPAYCRKRHRTNYLRLSGVLPGCILLAIAFSGAQGAFEPDENSNNLVDKFLDANRRQQQAMRGVEMEMDIDAQLPKLKEQGKLKVLRQVSRLGQTTMRKLGEFVGDKTVQHEVIERYLQLQTDSSGDSSIAITP